MGEAGNDLDVDTRHHCSFDGHKLKGATGYGRKENSGLRS